MLKHKLTATEFAALPEALKQYYKQDGEMHLLQTDNATELINARDREKARADGLQMQITGLTGQITNLTQEVTTLKTKNSDVLAIEASHKATIEGINNAHKAIIDTKDKQLHNVLVTQTATNLATSMAGDNAHLLIPIIEKRLVADTTGENAVVKILAADGKPSELTLEKLQKELVDSGKYKSILVASHASGSAGNNNPSRPAAVPKDKKFKDLTEAERTAWYKEDKAGFEAAAAEARRVI